MGNFHGFSTKKYHEYGTFAFPYEITLTINQVHFLKQSET